MSIFDDPRRSLSRLNEELLAQQEEETEELAEEYEEEDYETFFREDYRQEYEKAPFIRNYSNGYGADIRNFANGYRGEDLMDEEDEDEWEESDEEPYALGYEDRRSRRRRLRQEKAEKKNRRRSRGTGWLKFLLVVQSLVILALIVWLVMEKWV